MGKWSNIINETTSNQLPSNKWSTKLKYDNKKPIKVIENPSNPTSLKNIILSSYVDKPENKIKLYAEGRGLKPENYEIIDDEIVFKHGDKIYREQTSGFIPATKRFLAEQLTDPANILGAVGLGGAGLGGAALGSAAGELTKQQIAQHFLNENKPIKEDIQDIGIAGLSGAASFKAGQYLHKGGKAIASIVAPSSKKALNVVASKLSKIKTEIPNINTLYGSDINIEKIIDLQNEAKKFGINLNLGQTTRDQRIISLIEDLKKTPGTAEKISEISSLQNEAIKSSIPDFMKNIFGTEGPSNTKIGTLSFYKLREAAKNAVQNLNIQRKNITEPFYKKAFEENPLVKTQPLIDHIKRLSQDLTKSQQKEIKQIIVDLSSEPNSDIAITSLLKLDNIKKQIDGILYGKSLLNSTDKAERKVLKEINKSIIELSDSVSPSYKKARLIHSLLTDNNSIFAQTRVMAKFGLKPLAEFPDKNLQNAASFLLANKKMRPSILEHVKTKILNEKNGKEIWNDALKDYLKYTIESSIDISKYKTSNIGSIMLKKIFGTEHQRKIWKTALSKEQFDSMKNYFRILQRIGLTFKDTVIPTSKVETNQTFKSKLLRSFQPLISIESLAAKNANDLLTGKGYDELFKLLFDPNTDQTLKKILTLKTRNEKAEKLVQLMTMVGFRNISD